MSNPRAFPGEFSSGMTLLDYFAAQALVGLVAHIPATEDVEGYAERLAIDAYELADKMIQQRQHEQDC